MRQTGLPRVALIVASCSSCVLESSVQYLDGGSPNIDGGGQQLADSGQGAPPQPQGDAGQWINVTANLAGMPSECGDLTYLSSRPDRDMLIAGVAQHGLWVNLKGDSHWTQLGQGAGSAVITNRASSIVYDPSHPDTFWESGIYNGGGVYKTLDNGQTFIQLGSATHCDGVSIDFTDPERKTLLAGGHEATKLYRSTDGGNTWTDVAPNLPTGAGFTGKPVVISSQVHLLGSYSGTAPGVFRTVDGGNSWKQVYAGAVVGTPLVASDNSIYWLLFNDAGLIKSTDSGASWTPSTGHGILSTYVGGASLNELPDGRLVSLGTQSLVISADKGKTWKGLGPAFPYHPIGTTYSTFRNSLYIWHANCVFATPDSVLPDAILALSFDYTTQ